MTSSDELNRIERFVAAYNEIDDFLQQAIGRPQTFRAAVDHYAKRHPWWNDAETLRLYATLRNFLVHEKTRPFVYPCAPTVEAVAKIEGVRDRLLHPARLLPTFEREVVTLSPEDRLDEVLRDMVRRTYRRFPVYENGRFIGILSERGIARWLADTLARQDAGQNSVKLDIPVREILPRETKRPSFRFASGKTPVREAAEWFRENTFLETVLISTDGGARSPLRGIATRSDLSGE